MNITPTRKCFKSEYLNYISEFDGNSNELVRSLTVGESILTSFPESFHGIYLNHSELFVIFSTNSQTSTNKNLNDSKHSSQLKGWSTGLFFLSGATSLRIRTIWFQIAMIRSRYDGIGSRWTGYLDSRRVCQK